MNVNMSNSTIDYSSKEYKAGIDEGKKIEKNTIDVDSESYKAGYADGYRDGARGAHISFNENELQHK